MTDRDTKIIELVRQGMSHRRIAAIAGVGRTTVGKVARANGLVKKKGNPKDVRGRNEQLTEHIKQGMLYADIAKKFSVSVNVVQTVSCRAGLAKRRDAKKQWIPTPEEIEERVKPFREIRQMGLTPSDAEQAILRHIRMNKGE